MKPIPLLLHLVAFLHGAALLQATDYTFTSSGVITFAGLGASRQSSPYPSTVSASGIPAGTVTGVRITLNGLSLVRPDDAEMVLVSPSGAKLVFWADNGGAVTPVSGLTVTLDDGAATLLPDGSGLATGSFRPSCVDFQNTIATEFPSLTVASPGDCATPRGSATFTTQFGGTFTTAAPGAGNPNPNGTWSLYTVDDVATDDVSTITSWTLVVSADVTTVGTTTTLVSSAPSSTTGNAVTFTATVKKTADNTAVTSGTVTFKEGATTLAANVALNGSGQATFTTSALAEGDHTITATYNPAAGFLTSNASAAQRVDNATLRTGNTFANTGNLANPGTAPTFGAAAVYPSRVFVSGLSGSISKLTLSITNLSVGKLDDVELLLVAPGGQTFTVLGDAGGTATPISLQTFTFDDAAGSLIGDTTAPAGGTYRPSSYDPSDDAGSAPNPGAFLPPPPGPYPHPAAQGSSTFASVFSGSNPNGTWSLYFYDDVQGDGASSIAGGWALTFTTTGDASTTTTVTSAVNPTVVGASAVFTATVVATSGGAPVTVGSVTFRQGATVLAGPTALNGSGQAVFATTSLVEGNHVISVDYSGSPGFFNVSTSVPYNHMVDGVTTPSDVTATGGSYCNGSLLTIPATQDVASVYPSHINVASLSGPITGVTLSLKGITVDRPDDIELLLVGPTGANLVVMNDVGGTSVSAVGVDLILDDAAAAGLPDSGGLASGTFRPTSSNTGTSPNFPAPAPAPGSLVQAAPAGAGTLASQFAGTSAEGAWSLYARDDVTGGGVTLTGGWCLTFTVNAPPVANPETVNRDKDRSIKVPVSLLMGNDTDPNGTTPTFVSVSSSSAHGAALHVVDNTWVVYEAVPGSNTDDTFTYTITDGTSTSDGTVTVRVERPNGQTANLVISAVPGTVTLTLFGIPGRTYQFEYTDDLTPPITWNPLGAPQAANASGQAVQTDTSGLTRFYRAIED